MTTKDMLGLSVAGGRKEEIRESLRPDHIWSIDCREELVPEQRVRRIPHLVRAPWLAPAELSEVYARFCKTTCIPSNGWTVRKHQDQKYA